jgi:hypothetical protein
VTTANPYLKEIKARWTNNVSAINTSMSAIPAIQNSLLKSGLWKADNFGDCQQTVSEEYNLLSGKIYVIIIW